MIFRLGAATVRAGNTPVPTPKQLRSASLAILALAACSDAATTGRDPAKIFATRTQTRAYADVPFDLETATFFRTTDVLPDLDVRALQLANEKVWAGTASGLAVLDASGARFVRGPAPADALPVVDLTLRRTGSASLAGTLVVAHPSAVDLVAPDGTVTRREVSTATSAPIVSAVLAAEGAALYVATAAGLVVVDAPAATVLRAPLVKLVAHGDVVYAASSRGVLRYDARARAELPAWSGRATLPDDDARALAVSADGEAILVATLTGTARITIATGASTITTAGIDGLPNADVRAIAEAGGAVLSGHAIGATVMNGAKKDHYHSLRWIPDEAVTAVALASDGTRWIGTHQGISKIAFVPSTLAEKAAHGEALLPRHWRMDGFLDDNIELDDGWAETGTPRTDDNDNDGLWTEMQIGTWCLAYSVTKDETYYERARKAMDVMQMQFDVPALTFQAAGRSPGFITRSLVRDDEGEVFESKKTQSNWHRQDFGGRTYYWKDDTSSDEYAGHYFGIPLFYDLCAKSEAEKEELRKRIRMSTDYVMEGDFLLLDLDGEQTTHGHWKDLGAASDGLDACTSKYGFDIAHCLDTYGGGGWLNSLEILGHLLATWHMTGDQKYYDAYEELYTNQRYGKMIRIHDELFTVTSPSFANHSDHELAMLAYYTLLRYEPNEDRRALIVQSIRDFYEWEREEHNPWQVAVIASAFDQDVDLDGAIQSLKDMPTNWREVPYDNSHRVDAKRNPNDRHGDEQFDRVFPYDELRIMKWNGNPYAVSEGGNPRSFLVPTSYLIAYWTARYHGLITDSE